MNKLLKINMSRRGLAAAVGVSLIGTTNANPLRNDLKHTTKNLQNYSDLRNYREDADCVQIIKLGLYGTFIFDSEDTITADDGGTVIVDILNRRWKRQFSGSVFLEWFGAAGNGTTDDTLALVNAFLSKKNIICQNKTYAIMSDSQYTIENFGKQRIVGSGNSILKINKKNSTNLFIFKGPVMFKNIIIDFNNGPAQYPFRWAAHAGHIRIHDVQVRNLNDKDNRTGSITFFIIPTGNTFDIRCLHINSMKKLGNGIITDANGSYNCIYIGGGPGSTQGCIDGVIVNSVHNVNEAGKIVYEDTSIVYIATDASDSTNTVKICNINGFNFGKRLLKIHASNVSIDSVTGHSIEGDALGVIGFLNDQGLGIKNGCSASNVRAIGNMEYAFSSSAPNTKWKNIIASIQPDKKSTKPGLSTALLINGDNTEVDGFWSDSNADIGIGSSIQIIKNTTLKNLYTVLDKRKSTSNTIFNISSTIGFDGLLIDGLNAVVSADSTADEPIYLARYINSQTKKGRNLKLQNITIKTNAPTNSNGIILKHVENLSISGLKYINLSGNIHNRILQIEDSKNVFIQDVLIEGMNQIGISLKNVIDTVTVLNVVNPFASKAVVYNNNCNNFLAIGCDQTKVFGQHTPAYQQAKLLIGSTLNRPVVDLVAGWTQYFDTTINKPLWWNGFGWSDANGVSV